MNPKWSCQFAGHQKEKISSFCFNHQCLEEFLCCMKCAVHRHPDKSVIEFISMYKQVFTKLLEKFNKEKEQICKQLTSIQKFYKSLLGYLQQLEEDLEVKKFEELKQNVSFFKEIYRSSFSLPRLLYKTWEIIEPLRQQMDTFKNKKLPWEKEKQFLELYLQDNELINTKQEQLQFSDDIETSYSTFKFQPKIVCQEFKFFSCDQNIPENDFREISMGFDSNPHNYIIGVCQKKLQGVSLSWDQIKDGNYGFYVIDKNGQFFSQNSQSYGFQKMPNHIASNVVLIEIDRIFNRLNITYYLGQQKQEIFTIHNLPPQEGLFLCVGLQFGKCQLIQPPIYLNQK